MTQERVERIGARITVRRRRAPDDVAAAVRLLASAGTAFVNGTVLDVDGGRRRQD